MNTEEPVKGVSNCIFRDVIFYLTAQNLNGDKIYRKIVEIFVENVIVEQKVFRQMFRPFSNRFHNHLGFELLTKV